MSRTVDLAELELHELEDALESKGTKRFHARQLYRWIYRRGERDSSVTSRGLQPERGRVTLALTAGK